MPMNLLKFQILSGSAQLNWSPVPATAELGPAQPQLVEFFYLKDVVLD